MNGPLTEENDGHPADAYISRNNQSKWVVIADNGDVSVGPPNTTRAHVGTLRRNSGATRIALTEPWAAVFRKEMPDNMRGNTLKARSGLGWRRILIQTILQNSLHN